MLQTGLCVKFSRNVDRVERGESDTRSARRFSMADYPCGGSGLHNVRMMQNPDKTKKPDPSSDENFMTKCLKTRDGMVV